MALQAKERPRIHLSLSPWKKPTLLASSPVTMNAHGLIQQSPTFVEPGASLRI